MTFNANLGAERPLPSPRAGSPVAGAEAGAPGSSVRNDQPARHSPEAEGLLQRYLSEIHSYRQLGNAALRELESRLEALSGDRQPSRNTRWHANGGLDADASLRRQDGTAGG